MYEPGQIRERMTHSRMWVNENSGWFIVSSEVWMLWFESSNVLSMLPSTLAR